MIFMFFSKNLETLGKVSQTKGISISTKIGGTAANLQPLLDQAESRDLEPYALLVRPLREVF